MPTIPEKDPRMNRVIFLLAPLAMLVALTPDWAAGQDQPKDPQWTHAFDLACRKLGEAEFTPSTQKFGVEALRDQNVKLGLYVTEKGAIALAPGFEGLPASVPAKTPIWITGLDLPARKAGEKDFNKAKTYCLEIFRDPHTDNALFITSDGRVAAASAKGKILAGSKTPKCIHSVDLNVRKGGEKDWKDAAKIGIETYRDENTGNLIYISDSGAVAVVADGQDERRCESRDQSPRMAAWARSRHPQAGRADVHERHETIRRRSLPRRRERQHHLHLRDRFARRRPRRRETAGPDAEREGTRLEPRLERESPQVRREGVFRADDDLRRRSLSG